MTITWLGYSCFRLQSRDATVLIDPYSSDIGYKLGKQHCDIVLTTHDHPNHSDMEFIADNPLVFKTQGEYEAKDVFIYGLPSFHDKKDGSEKGRNIIFLVDI